MVHAARRRLRRARLDVPRFVPAGENDGRGSCILLLEADLPQPNRSGGHGRLLTIADALKNHGFNVVIGCCNDLATTAHYWAIPLDQLTREAEQLRRRFQLVLGCTQLSALLRTQGPALSAVWFSRTLPGMFYLDQVLSNAPQARLVFDSMDAEHVRLVRRMKTLAGGIESDVVDVRLRERLMVSVSDVVVAVTQEDLRALMELDPATDARGLVIPNLYDLTRDMAPHNGQEWDAVFVGGFVHEPNVDAIRWLVEEICPLLSTRIRIRIVGHGLPTSFATMARAAGMTYLGEVDDLSHIYASTKFAIAPLRFGSGVKGKVIEAALHGLPVVGTPVAWEGIQVEEGVSGIVADTAREFADAMQRLTVNPALRNNLAQASFDWLNNFGVDAHRDALLAAVRPG